MPASVLWKFRARLLQHEATERLLTRLLAAAREDGLLKGRTDSTHVLAAVRDLNRLELVGGTLRAALNAIAVQRSQARGLRRPDRGEWLHAAGRVRPCGRAARCSDVAACGRAAPRKAPIHDALAAKEPAPSEHLVDSAASAPTTSLPLARGTASTWSAPGGAT